MKRFVILLLVVSFGCASKPEPMLLHTVRKTVVYDFGAKWCAPCKRFAPTFDAWAQKYATDTTTFLKIDIDDNPDLSRKYNIRSVPTVVVEVNGKVVERFQGAPREEDLRRHLQ